MLKSIDEGIKHCEKVSEALRAKVSYKIFNDDYWTQEELDCLECAKEYRQLANWLKELKAYREINN